MDWRAACCGGMVSRDSKHYKVNVAFKPEELLSVVVAAKQSQRTNKISVNLK